MSESSDSYKKQSEAELGVVELRKRVRDLEATWVDFSNFFKYMHAVRQSRSVGATTICSREKREVKYWVVELS